MNDIVFFNIRRFSLVSNWQWELVQSDYANLKAVFNHIKTWSTLVHLYCQHIVTQRSQLKAQDVYHDSSLYSTMKTAANSAQLLSHSLLNFSAYWLVLLTNLQQILGEIRYRLLYAYILFGILVTQALRCLVNAKLQESLHPCKTAKSFSQFLFLSNYYMFNFPVSWYHLQNGEKTPRDRLCAFSH